MEAFFNELSLQPSTCNSIADCQNNIKGLLDTMKSIKEHGFNVLRTHHNFYAEVLGADYSFANYLGDTTVPLTLRTLLRSIVKAPYIEESDSYEADEFIMNSFKTLDHSSKMVSPEGIACAYVYKSVVVSLDGYAHWQKDILQLEITDAQQVTKNEDIINLYCADSSKVSTFRNWLISLQPPIPLNSLENIIKLFPIHQFSFDKRAIDDIIFWYYDDSRYQTRIISLIQDIKLHPFVGGIGRTESLSGTGGGASKRIVGKDRIVYTYTQNMITIHQCRGHYDDK